MPLSLPRKLAISLTVASLALALSGCASVPRFHPSRPLLASQSVPESLLACGEYRIEPRGSRPVAMRPYLDCIDQAVSPERRGWTEAAGLFREEVFLLYRLEREETWNPAVARQVDAAIQGALKALWRGGAGPGLHSREERDALRAYLPRTASRLGAESWRTGELRATDPELERLKAQAASLEDRDFSRRMRHELGDLDATFEDLCWMNRLDPRNPQTQAVERRYRARLADLGHRLADYARD